MVPMAAWAYALRFEYCGEVPIRCCSTAMSAPILECALQATGHLGNIRLTSSAFGSLVTLAIVETDMIRRSRTTDAALVLSVLPFRLVAAFRHQRPQVRSACLARLQENSRLREDGRRTN